MEIYAFLKLVHILGAAILFGTGLGIAFFMFWADRSRDAQFILGTANTVIVADFLFTASAVVVQPISGIALVYVTGYSLWESWIILSLLLYVLIGVCWLPVVFIQIALRNCARAAVDRGEALGPDYQRLMRIWFWLGWPAFFGMICLFWLMISKPEFWN